MKLSNGAREGKTGRFNLKLEHLFKEDFSERGEFMLKMVSFFYKYVCCGMKLSPGISIVSSHIRS